MGVAGFWGLGSVCFGIVLVIIGLILVGEAPPQELPLWYQAQFCPTVDPAVWVGRQIAPNEACPPQLSVNSYQDQGFVIPAKIMEDESRDFYPVVFRRFERGSFQISMVDANERIIFDTGVVEATTDTTDLNKREAPARQLMKAGGYYYSGSYRTRTGYSSRYAGNTYYRRNYGYYGRSAVKAETVVFVYTRSGTTSNVADPDAFNCQDVETGCAMEIRQDLDRDEFENFAFKPNEQKTGTKKREDPVRFTYPYRLTVSNLKATPKTSITLTVDEQGTITGEKPSLYVAFWSPDLHSMEVAGWTLFGLGMGFVFCFSWCGWFIIDKTIDDRY